MGSSIGRSLVHDAIALMQLAPYTPDGKHAALAFVERWLTDAGIRYQRHAFERGPVLTAEVGPTEGPVLAWLVQLDVVPPSLVHWNAPYVEGGVLHGRGSAGMLGAAAAALHAIRRLRDQSQVRVRVVFVIDGAVDPPKSIEAYKAERGNDIAFAVALEPTGERVAIQSTGSMHARLLVEGVPGLSAPPHPLSNAIENSWRVWEGIKGLDFLDAPPTAFFPEGPTVALTGIQVEGASIDGGSLADVIPSSCRMVLSLHFLPGQQPDRVLAEIRALVERMPFKVSVHAESYHPAVAVSKANPYVQALCEVVAPELPIYRVLGTRSRATDAAFFGGVAFGPVGWDRHGPRERVSIQSLIRTSDHLVAFAARVADATA